MFTRPPWPVFVLSALGTETQRTEVGGSTLACVCSVSSGNRDTENGGWGFHPGLCLFCQLWEQRHRERRLEVPPWPVFVLSALGTETQRTEVGGSTLACVCSVSSGNRDTENGGWGFHPGLCLFCQLWEQRHRERRLGVPPWPVFVLSALGTETQRTEVGGSTLACVCSVSSGNRDTENGGWGFHPGLCLFCQLSEQRHRERRLGVPPWPVFVLSALGTETQRTEVGGSTLACVCSVSSGNRDTENGEWRFHPGASLRLTDGRYTVLWTIFGL
ncbi:uncharacterized protein LOC116374361 [Oncorhynchus kisutch]|uniref:uncharacterized protein LOC116374361 n=1 Tax=Oncorhynchus kisutch TaxID=8019 RepID=UPI0012DDD809|nr:uncharacterized protein LOC116374361 [Oncorhynchus kisutch]